MLRRIIPRYSLRTLLIFLTVLPCGLGVLLYWPKSEPLRLNERYYTVYYRGLGWNDENSWLGKRHYKVIQRYDESGVYSEIDFSGEGYNSFRSYYPDGRLSQEGRCYVEIMGSPYQPFPDTHDVPEAKCYKPDGSLGSAVENGTGTQLFWFPDGQLQWRLELKDHERVLCEMWLADGTLFSRTTYVDGQAIYDESVIANRPKKYSVGLDRDSE